VIPIFVFIIRSSDAFFLLSKGGDLLEALAIALNDFNDLTSVAALRQIINVIKLNLSLELEKYLK
jgi:hypothetical protein